jgi:hypothetical protein
MTALNFFLMPVQEIFEKNHTFSKKEMQVENEFFQWEMDIIVRC